MTETKCPVCGKGQLVWVEDILSEFEGYVFVEQGHRCTHCGEEFIPEEEGERTIRIARRLNLWGEPLKLRRKLSRSGRGTVLRIPADLKASLDLKGDEEVALSRIGRDKILVEILH